MNEPTGYTALDLIGYTDKGDYSAVATYVKNDLVNYGGSKWRCLIDDTTGVTPVEGLNWTVFVQIPADSTKQIIAPVEQATSTHAYTVGEQLIYNDTLYKVKAPIAIGDSLVVDTNIEASDTIVEQIDQNASDIDDIDAEISAICNVYGSKNMCPTESRVIQGFTYAPDKDGYMSCSTSTDTRSWGYTYANQKFRLKKGTYFIKAFEKTAYTTGYVGLQIFDSNGNSIFTATWATLLSIGQTFTLAADTDIGVEYKVGDGAYAFMIMDNRIKDRTYVPHAMNNRELTESKAENSVIGTVENDATASKAYGVGARFVRNGKNCIVIAAIAQGATLTENTNYVIHDVNSMEHVARGVFNGDCDTLAPGVIYVSNTATNAPFSWAVIYTSYSSLSGANRFQIAFRVIDFGIAYRWYGSNTWSAWKTVTLS